MPSSAALGLENDPNLKIFESKRSCLQQQRIVVICKSVSLVLVLALAVASIRVVEARARNTCTFATKSSGGSSSPLIAFVGGRQSNAAAAAAAASTRDLRSGRTRTNHDVLLSSLSTPTKPFVCGHCRAFTSLSKARGEHDGSNDIVNDSMLADDGDDENIVPLVFLHGIKGSHLALSSTNGKGADPKTQRSWLSLGGLLNFPPKDDNHPDRDLSLPLSYTFHNETNYGNNTKKTTRHTHPSPSRIEEGISLMARWITSSN